MSNKETGYKKIEGHWTDHVRLNHKFAANLQSQLPGTVSNAAAYQIYLKDHRRPRPEYAANEPEDDIYKMNVRNQLAKMARLGILESVRPGLYIWAPQSETKEM